MPQNPPSLQGLLDRIAARKEERQRPKAPPQVPGPQVRPPAPPPPPEPEGPGFWGTYGAPVLRGAAGFFGGPAGALASGTAEAGAELMEGRELSPWEIGLEAALGFIPMKGGSLLKAIAKGAGLSAADAGARDVIQGGRTAEEIGNDMLSAGVFGGVGGGALHGLVGAFRGAPEPPAGPKRPPGWHKPVAPPAPRDLSVWQSPEPIEGLSFEPSRPTQQIPPSRGPIPGRPVRPMEFGPEGSEALTSPLSISDPNEIAKLLAQIRGGAPASAGPGVGVRVRPEGGAMAPPAKRPAPRQPMPPLQGRAPADLIEPTQPPMNFEGPTGPGTAAAPAFDEFAPLPGKTPEQWADEFIQGATPARARGNGLLTDELAQALGMPPRDAPATIPAVRTPASGPAAASLPGGASFLPREPGIPDPIAALHRELGPAWEKMLAAQEGDGIPFTVDPREGLDEFRSRIMGEDPRRLMGKERQVRGVMDRVGGDDPGGEGGFVDVNEVAKAAKGLPRAATNLRFGAMLSNPGTQVTNLTGAAIGSGATRAAEEAVSGDTAAAKKLMRALFSQETVGDIKNEFHNPQPYAGARWSPDQIEQRKGITGFPGRVMGAVDAGFTDAMKRGGLSGDDAVDTMRTGQPKSDTGRRFVSAATTPLGRVFAPFPRIATRLFEGGMERLPGIGLMDDVKAMTAMTPARRKALQILGGASVAGGALLAPGMDPETHKPGRPNRLLMAALGPYALPAALGVGMRQAFDHSKSNVPESLLASIGNTLSDALPVPGMVFDTAGMAGKYVSSHVPNLLSHLDPNHTPNMYDVRKHELIGPALAKIPWLRDLLLDKKPGAKGRPKENR